MQRMNFLHQASMLVASAVSVTQPEKKGSTALSRVTAPSAATLRSDPPKAVAQLINRMTACKRALNEKGFAGQMRPYGAQLTACINAMNVDWQREVVARSPQDTMAKIATVQKAVEEVEAAIIVELSSRRTLGSTTRWIKHRLPIGEVFHPDVPDPNCVIRKTHLAAHLAAGAASKPPVLGQDKNLSTVFGSDLRSVARKSVLRMCV